MIYCNFDELRDAVLNHGVEVEFVIYPGEGHGFNNPGLPTFSEKASTDSYIKTIKFLRAKLF